MLLQVLAKYGREWIVKIQDVTDFVHEQYKNVTSRELDKLMVAEERVYPIVNPDIARQIQLTDETEHNNK